MDCKRKSRSCSGGAARRWLTRLGEPLPTRAAAAALTAEAAAAWAGPGTKGAGLETNTVGGVAWLGYGDEAAATGGAAVTAVAEVGGWVTEG